MQIIYASILLFNYINIIVYFGDPNYTKNLVKLLLVIPLQPIDTIEAIIKGKTTGMGQCILENNFYV